jgi:CubicO group peptidase (beta-lactamase class C family)
VKPLTVLFGNTLLTASLFVSAARGQNPAQSGTQTVDTIAPALRERIDQIANQVLELRGVPSASIAVVEGGKLAYTHAYGLAHLDPAEHATPAMRYSIGSISKQFTAVAILLLQEQASCASTIRSASMCPA